MTPTIVDGRNATRGPDCHLCGSPTGLPWRASRIDGVTPYCAACRPVVRPPRINLYARPEGQELARWTDV